MLSGTFSGTGSAALDFSAGKGTISATGTLAKADITVGAAKEASISLAQQTDVLSLQSGKINITAADGKLSLAKGTLELGSDVVLTNTTAAKGSISVAEGATLQANTSIIKSFMAADGDTPDQKGNVVLSGTWVLTGDNNDLGNIAIGEGASAGGELALGANSLIKGANVAVSEAITGTATNLKIEADTLTLGKADAASDALLGAGKAKAKDLVLKSNDTDGFKLKDDITLTAVSGTTEKTADSVTLEEKIVLAGNGKTLTVEGGNYTAADLTVGSGSVTVTNHADNVDSTLTIGKLVLDNNKNGATGKLTAKSTAAGALDKVILDLTNADISYAVKASTQNSITLEADKATIKIAGDKLTELLNVESSFSGAIFDVKNDGQLLVTEGLDLKAAQLKKSTATNNGLKLNKGTLNVDGTLTLKGAATVDLENADGSAILKAKTLDLQVADPATESSILQSGNFVVSEGLKTNSQDAIVVGANGKLQLNDEADASHTVYANALSVSGDSAILEAVKGNWTLTNLSLGTTGVANVKSGAGLNVTKLTATDAASRFNVADGANATVEQIESSAADQINVSGVMTVAGKITQDGKNPPSSYGVDLAAKSVKMEKTGKLSFGDAATQSIKVNKDGIEVLAESFKDGAIKSVAGSEVAFSFDETTNFTAEALKDLRTKIFGVTGDKLVDGRINLGKATIAGIDENIVDNKISWEKIEGLSDSIGDTTSEQLSQAIVTDVTSADNIRGHYGAIQSKDTGAITIGGNTSLNNAAANNGMFAQGIDKQPSDFNVNVGTLELNNGGQAGKVSLAENTTLS